MNVIRWRDRDYADRLGQAVGESSLFDPAVEQRVREVIEAVRDGGDGALLELTERFDGAKLYAEQLAVSAAERMNASLGADESLRRAIGVAAKNIRDFSRRSLRKTWSGRNGQGAKVGEKYDPIQRVGIYVPGGTAPLVSTALMTVLLARVAGCPEIVVCTPCGRTSEVNPSLLYALNASGATEVYRLGGAQAIAAMALGTPTIRKVLKIYGPGNAYVVAAKRLLFGQVAVDLLPGPSEVLVLADDSAEPRYVAADLLAQAEHGSGHERVWLVTPSSRLLQRVEREIERQLPQRRRRDLIERALAKNGWLIQVKDLKDAVDVANQIAPEHCEIMAHGASRLAAGIVTAGAIFLGAHSPTVLGDYVAGPSHELPTGGAGAALAGLTVEQFQRRTSVVEYDRGSLRKSLSAVQVFAQVEGLDAHGQSAAIRFEKVPRRKGSDGESSKRGSRA